MKQKNNNKNKRKKIDNNIKKINKDTDEMLLSKYIIGEIDFIDDVYDISLWDTDFIKAFFRNGSIKREKWVLKKINKYIDKESKEFIDSLIFLIKEKEWITIDGLIEERIKLAWYNKEDDPRNLRRMDIIFRRELEKDLYFIANYLKDKLSKEFITKKISKDNISLKLLVKRYNMSLAKLKYLFYSL